MVLDDVADRAGLIVERAAALDPEGLGHRDLHAFDELAIPERLEERVGEAEEDQVVHRPLAEVMIDAKDVLLIETAEQNLVQRARRLEIAPERLFHDDARAARASRLREMLDHRCE